MNKNQSKSNIWLTVAISLFIFSGCYDDPAYPLANFEVQGGVFVPGFKYVLDASSSIAQSGTNDQLQYRWDLNGDRVWDEAYWSNSPMVTAVLNGDKWEAVVGLQVKDANNNIVEMHKKIVASSTYYRPTIYQSNSNNIHLDMIQYRGGYYRHWSKTNILLEEAEGIINGLNYGYGSFLDWGKASGRIVSNYRLPTLDEWTEMIKLFGGTGLAGYNLAVDGEHGLSLKYGGRFVNVALIEKDLCGYYWTATSVNDQMAYAVKITKGKDKVEIVELPKDMHLSVRLISSISQE